jgi:cytochrome o ubiquinol oxidase operon protein cyoD
MNDVRNLGNIPPWQRPHVAGGPLRDAYRAERRNYIMGLILALALTLGPFALVYWHALTTRSVLLAIGLLALVQAMVHFRFFLNIRPPHENSDELAIILFTTLILIMMVGGTVWILANLHARMY